MANPLLTGVEVEYPENAILDLTQNTYKHFYDGSEIVVAGRLVDEEMNSFKADVKGHGVSGPAPGCMRACGVGTDGALATWGMVQQCSPEPGPRAPGLQPSSLSYSPTPAQAVNDLTFTEEVDVKEMEKALKEQDYIFGNYIERLWAYLTIEQLLEKR